VGADLNRRFGTAAILHRQYGQIFSKLELTLTIEAVNWLGDSKMEGTVVLPDGAHIPLAASV